MTHPVPARALGLLFLAAAALAAGCGGSDNANVEPQPEGALELSVTSRKATYAADEQVLLDVVLTNGSDAPLAVSRALTLVLEVVGITRDGGAVSNGILQTSPEAGVASGQAASLVTLQPGEAATAVLEQFLFTEAVVGGTAESTVYDVDLPGSYAVELRYRYTGDVPAGVPVATEPTASSTATFVRSP